MLAKIFVVGRVKRDSKLVTPNQGKPFLQVTVEVVNSYNGKTYTKFFDVAQYLKPSESHFAAGQMVAVEGTPDAKTYKGKDDTTHAIIKVVGTVTLLHTGISQQASPEKPVAPKQEKADDDSDDVPF